MRVKREERIIYITSLFLLPRGEVEKRGNTPFCGGIKDPLLNLSLKGRGNNERNIYIITSRSRRCIRLRILTYVMLSEVRKRRSRSISHEILHCVQDDNKNKVTVSMLCINGKAKMSR